MLFFDGMFKYNFYYKFQREKKLQSYKKDDNVFCLEKIDLKDV